MCPSSLKLAVVMTAVPRSLASIQDMLRYMLANWGGVGLSSLRKVASYGEVVNGGDIIYHEGGSTPRWSFIAPPLTERWAGCKEMLYFLAFILC